MVLDRQAVPEIADWNKGIANILQSIDAKVTKKVVLGRKVFLHFEAEVSALAMMQRLSDTRCQEFLFCFQFQPGVMLLGRSPERLFYRQDRNIETEAIAGTRRLGDNPNDDARLQTELLNSTKDQHEHELVLSMLQKQLAQLCFHSKVDCTGQIIRTNGGIHILSRLSGQLKDGVTDKDIINLLHPTPAVAGTPTRLAMKMIRDLEPFARGWFTGSCGYLSRNESQFAVIIRSGLLSKNNLTLFAGAGIVSGSEATTEWAEVENKLRCIEQVLVHEYSAISKY